MIKHSDRVVRVTRNTVLNDLVDYLKSDVVVDEDQVRPDSDLGKLLEQCSLGLSAGLLAVGSFASQYQVPEVKIKADYLRGELRGITVEGFADYIVSNSRGLAA